MLKIRTVVQIVHVDTKRAWVRRQLSDLVPGVVSLCLLMVPAGLWAQSIQAPVNLGTAGNYVILSETGITDVSPSPIVGNIGASPITGAAILVTCSEVTGTTSSVDAAGPSPCSLIVPGALGVAINDMAIAYADAAGRATPDFINLGAGDITGLTLVPGLYKWGTDVLISAGGVTLSGGPNAVWVFQIAGDLNLANNGHVFLAGGARANNIFWQVGASSFGATLGTGSVMNGTILSAKQVIENTGSSLVGRALAQTQVTLQSTTVTTPGPLVGGVPIPVGPALQTITFGPISNVAVGTAPFSVSATASSGLTVSFSSNNPSVCAVNGSTVTIVKAGGCPITASQAGDSTFAPTSVIQSFTVLFADVAPTDYYYAAINAIAQLGITAGCGNNDYCPQQNITRDEAAILIVRAIVGSDNFTYPTAPYFSDVTPTTFGFKWIQKLASLGITGGCGVGLYCPTMVVTRDQMAIFIERTRLGVSVAGSSSNFTYPTTPLFDDIVGDFAFPWIQRLKQDGITGGCTATSYCPTSPVIRGDMAIFIMRGAFNQFLPAGTPVITQISPSMLAAGTSGTFTVTGSNTNFQQGSTQLSPIPGVTIGTITVTSPTTMTVQLTAAANAVAQPYSVLAITGSEQDVLPNGLVLQ